MGLGGPRACEGGWFPAEVLADRLRARVAPLCGHRGSSTTRRSVLMDTSRVTPLPTSSGALTVTRTDDALALSDTLEYIPPGSASDTAAWGLVPSETARAAAPEATPE